MPGLKTSAALSPTTRPPLWSRTFRSPSFVGEISSPSSSSQANPPIIIAHDNDGCERPPNGVNPETPRQTRLAEASHATYKTDHVPFASHCQTSFLLRRGFVHLPQAPQATPSRSLTAGAVDGHTSIAHVPTCHCHPRSSVCAASDLDSCLIPSPSNHLAFFYCLPFSSLSV